MGKVLCYCWRCLLCTAKYGAEKKRDGRSAVSDPCITDATLELNTVENVIGSPSRSGRQRLRLSTLGFPGRVLVCVLLFTLFLRGALLDRLWTKEISGGRGALFFLAVFRKESYEILW
jgi:hypothetical protein